MIEFTIRRREGDRVGEEEKDRLANIKQTHPRSRIVPFLYLIFYCMLTTHLEYGPRLALRKNQYQITRACSPDTVTRLHLVECVVDLIERLTVSDNCKTLSQTGQLPGSQNPPNYSQLLSPKKCTCDFFFFFFFEEALDPISQPLGNLQ